MFNNTRDLQHFNLSFMGSIRSGGVYGSGKSEVYGLSLEISGLTVNRLLVPVSPSPFRGFEMLIGRDVLRLFSFTYRGPENSYEFI